MMRKNFWAFFLATGIALTAGWSTHSDAAEPNGMIELMQRLMGNHMDSARQRDATYLAALAARDAAWQAAMLAESALGVKVTATATSFYTDRTEESRLTSGTVDDQRSFNAHQIAIGARKPLYRKKEKIAIEQAFLNFQQNEALADYAEQELYGRVFIAWMDVLSARDQFRTATESLAQGEVIRLEMERRFRAGEVSVDQLGIETAKLHQLQSDYLDTYARLGIAQRQLLEIVGPEGDIPEHFSLDLAKPNPLMNYPEQRILEIAEQTNFELRAARFAEQSTALEREKMSADRTPTLDLYASVSKGENDTASYIKDESRIGVQLSIPLWTAGAVDASVAQAEAQYRRSQSQTQAVAQRVRINALSALSRLQSLSARVEAANSLIQAHQIRMESVRRGFLAGTVSRGDLARAESDYLGARHRRTTDMRDYASQWASLAVITSSARQPAMQISSMNLSGWFLPMNSPPNVQVLQARVGP